MAIRNLGRFAPFSLSVSLWLSWARALPRIVAPAAAAVGLLSTRIAVGAVRSSSSRVQTSGPIPTASLATTLAAVRAEGKAGGRVVLLNVWATWCDPCREELPELLRFYRENRARGVRLVMVSADEPEQQVEVRRVLREAASAAGLDAGLEVPVFIKAEDDTVFVDGLDRSWSGALPATFAFDARGARIRAWLGPVTFAELGAELGARPALTPPSTGADSGAPRSRAPSRQVSPQTHK